MSQRVSLFFTAKGGNGGASPVAQVDEIVEFKHVVRAIVKNHGNCSVVVTFLGSVLAGSGFSAETTVPGTVTVPAKSERVMEAYLTAHRNYFKVLGVATPVTIGPDTFTDSEVEVEIREIVPTTGLTIR